MSAQKTERLINLTLALLATKRHLTKSEIFKAVAGYSGSPETMERMFERDKDELRSLGIEIEVKGIDPLFEDEQGYLIRSETFQLRDNEFSKEELLYLTMAANLWHDTALGSDSKAALLKIQSLSGPIESDAVNTPALRDSESAALLSSAFEAVDAEQLIKFGYKGKDRTAQPFGLYTKDGFWYLVAREENEVKSFKLLRIEGKIVKEGKAGSFKKPPEFDLIKFLSNSRSEQEILAQVLVRKEQAHVLRSKYSTREIDDEWDLMLIPYIYEQEIIETILWYGTNVIVNSPASLRSEVISRLKVIANG
jgi:proteasome accessory factor B